MSKAEKGTLCPSSTLQRLPGDLDSLQSCSSLLILAGSGLAGRAPLLVLRVVLKALDDISNRFALIADLIHSCEEGEPVGR